MSVVDILNYLVKSAACLSFFYAIYLLVLNNETCFRFNRIYLITALLLSIVLPLISIPLLVTESSPIDPSLLILPEVIIQEEMMTIPNSTNLFDYLLITYYVIAGVLLLKLLFSIYKIVQIIYSHRSEIMRDSHYRIINTHGLFPTSSFFNYIFWDDNGLLSSTDREQILKHEKTHVDEFHTLDILVLELVGVIFWFNPLIWLIKKRLVENHEFTADYKAAIYKEDYATLLVRQTLQKQGLTLAHPFKSHEILRRLKMLHQTNRKTWFVKYTLIIVMLGFMIFTMSFSVERITNNLSIIAPKIDNKQPSIHRTEKNSKLQLPTIKEVELPVARVTPDILKPKAITTLVPQITEYIPSFYSPSSVEKEVFTIVEESASPKIGMENFYKSITKKLKYPKSARKRGIEGRVFVQFIVDKHGKLTNLEVIKGIHPDCDQAALDAVGQLPDWSPGQQRGKAVKQKIVLPITFSLS